MMNNHMGLIPLTDSVTIIRQDTTNKVDSWGVPIYSETSTDYKCHISYNYKNEAINPKFGSDVGTGKQVVYTAKIYLRGLVGLRYEDKISYLDMNGDTVDAVLISVTPVRDFGGKVLATCLYI